MKYHIHIPKLLEFALNVVCDDITLHGKLCLISSIPYPLYLRCITTYADKYDARRYSTYRFYRDIRHKADVNVEIGRLYPNVLDHVVLDDGDVNAKLITQVAQSDLIDDAAASIQRFASRCLAADKSGMLATMATQVIQSHVTLRKPLIDVLSICGVIMDPNYLYKACPCGMNDIIKRAIENGHTVNDDDMYGAILSGNCDTIKLVIGAYRGSYHLHGMQFVSGTDMINATVEFMELLMSFNIIHHGTHYKFSNIPSSSVLPWLFDHDVMDRNRMFIHVFLNAAEHSGHYFDMLRYLIEQCSFTVPRDILFLILICRFSDLGIIDYLIWHGADVNAVDEFGKNVLERSPLLIRYWIDKGLVIQPNDANACHASFGAGDDD